MQAFPPPNVVLHPDDAGSKVFLSIAHAFLSVDNRAMTIKDLAERASQFGLVCQNLSATAQAITTYIRAHKTRCDKEQDQPLLLSHTLSGTPADDDLVPALHSRNGGDSHPVADRLTNFRKGTAVWYLSRATGVPCPFSRAGIRLCDYVLPDAERPSQRESAGQKRKRPLRGCTAATDSERPPKVKLTLRLKPLPRPTIAPPPNSDESMSVDEESESSDDEPTAQPQKEEEWRLPPYPRRSISIPGYTPSAYPTYPSPTECNSWYKDPFRGSPIVEETPPPDSDDDLYSSLPLKLSLEALSRNDEMGWEADLDSEGDGDTPWESPGPRSPSVPLVPAPSEIAIKEEPRDVQGMLDAWDSYDTTARVPDVEIKTESPEHWELGPAPADWVHDGCIKQEDFGADLLFPPVSPIAQLSSQFSAFSFPESSSSDGPFADDMQAGPSSSPTLRQSPSAALTQQSTALPLSETPSIVTLLHSVTAEPTHDPVPSGFNLVPPTPCVSPLQTRCQPSSPSTTQSTPPKIVVRTCQPCNPPISATQIEDISVYQMMLGGFQLLRRIDTDFVKLSPIVAYSGAPPPLQSAIPSTTVITKGSPEACGSWVPLSAAQDYVKEHLHPDNKVLDIFLSEELVEMFPPALQDFRRSNAPARAFNQFGKHFSSTLEMAGLEVDDVKTTWDVPQSLPLHEPSPCDAAADAEAREAKDAPLTQTEQELFHELCVIPDWVEDADMTVDPPLPCGDTSEEARATEPLILPEPATTIEPTPVAIVPKAAAPAAPLRRSRRVADALAVATARTPVTRSRKSNSRNALS